MSVFREKVKSFVRKYVSPTFMAMLLISLLIWYLSKLSYTYMARVPVPVDIAGNRFEVECIAEATGYRIIGRRYFNKADISLSLNDVETTPSIMNDGRLVVSSYSLQNAISVRLSDMKILSVGEIPEIQITHTGW